MTHSAEGHPSTWIANMIRGCQSAQMVPVAAKLRIADQLEGGLLGASTLAKLTGSDEVFYTVCCAPLLRLLDTVQTGQTAFDHVYGKGLSTGSANTPNQSRCSMLSSEK